MGPGFGWFSDKGFECFPGHPNVSVNGYLGFRLCTLNPKPYTLEISTSFGPLQLSQGAQPYSEGS